MSTGTLIVLALCLIGYNLRKIRESNENEKSDEKPYKSKDPTFNRRLKMLKRKKIVFKK